MRVETPWGPAWLYEKGLRDPHVPGSVFQVNKPHGTAREADVTLDGSGVVLGEAVRVEQLRVEPIEGDDLTVKIYAPDRASGDDLIRAIDELERLYVVLWDEGPWDDEGDGQPYYEGWLRHRS